MDAAYSSAAILGTYGDANAERLKQTAGSLTSAQRPALGSPLSAEQFAEIDETAKRFEAMVVSQFLKHMFEGVKPDPLSGGGFAEEMYQGMMIQEYGRMMAETGGIGIADQVRAQMIQIQEAAQNGG